MRPRAELRTMAGQEALLGEARQQRLNPLLAPTLDRYRPSAGGYVSAFSRLQGDPTRSVRACHVHGARNREGGRLLRSHLDGPGCPADRRNGMRREYLESPLVRT